MLLSILFCLCFWPLLSFVFSDQNFDCMLVLEPPAAATVMTLLLCNDLARADENARASSSAATSPEVLILVFTTFLHQWLQTDVQTNI